MNPIIILGAGHAAYSLAREIRRHNTDIAITLITNDEGDSYYKPNLSKALASNKTPEQLILKTREQQQETLNIEVLAQQQVNAIEPENQVLELANGEWLKYSALVFATGADSRRFELAGNANADVLHVNDLNEYRVFASKIENVKHILIMGAGLVGCEFANDLHSQGITSTLVDPAPYPLATLLPAPLAKTLQNGLNDIGTTQHYNATVTELNANTGGYQATLSNGETVTADLVLSAAGLSVNTAMASAAGVHCNRGIVVDEHLQTNHANIYALGDCAEINGKLRPYIAPILPSVKALAQSLLGTPTEVTFGAMPVTVKTPCCPVVACPPETQELGEWHIEGDAPNLIAKFVTNGQTLGFACTGDKTAEARTLQAELAH